MPGRTISIGAQGFAEMRERNNFLVDKTAFIRDWWNADDTVTLICRPRRFGKTLTLDMVRCFLSTEYADRGQELFGGMEVWDDPAMRKLQGTVPVVSLSFASCKGADYEELRALMALQLREACREHAYLLDSSAVDSETKAFLARVSDGMDDTTAKACLNQLCSALLAHHGVNPVILLDEYDTPMQEAWLAGCWDEMARFVRGLFNATFKTNRSLGRALITGITRVASESIFSDMNNPNVITVTTDQYTTAFGFTEGEVFAAMNEMGLTDREGVRRWYDGFTFGRTPGIYNPWSITNYLCYGELEPWWANTSSNALVSSLVATGAGDLQHDFEALMAGGTIERFLDERVSFRTLGIDSDAAFSLLLASGYVRPETVRREGRRKRYMLRLTNEETMACFEEMMRGWFSQGMPAYNGFTRALLAGDLEEAEDYLGDVLLACSSSFDGGVEASDKAQPERFYHGLVLGMLVDLRGRYKVTSNGESGRGRYDVTLEPLRTDDPALVMEFKVFDPKREKTLEDTVKRARAQIRDRAYATHLVEAGIAPDRIREVGFAFRGKDVLVG